jgi:hypothetical protein
VTAPQLPQLVALLVGHAHQLRQLLVEPAHLGLVDLHLFLLAAEEHPHLLALGGQPPHCLLLLRQLLLAHPHLLAAGLQAHSRFPQLALQAQALALRLLALLRHPGQLLLLPPRGLALRLHGLPQEAHLLDQPLVLLGSGGDLLLGGADLRLLEGFLVGELGLEVAELLLVLLHQQAFVGLALQQPRLEVLDDGSALLRHFALSVGPGAFGDELVLELPDPALLVLLAADEFVLDHGLVELVLLELLLEGDLLLLRPSKLALQREHLALELLVEMVADGVEHLLVLGRLDH